MFQIYAAFTAYVFQGMACYFIIYIVWGLAGIELIFSSNWYSSVF